MLDGEIYRELFNALGFQSKNRLEVSGECTDMRIYSHFFMSETGSVFAPYNLLL